MSREPIHPFPEIFAEVERALFRGQRSRADVGLSMARTPVYSTTGTVRFLHAWRRVPNNVDAGIDNGRLSHRPEVVVWHAAAVFLTFYMPRA